MPPPELRLDWNRLVAIILEAYDRRNGISLRDPEGYEREKRRRERSGSSRA